MAFVYHYHATAHPTSVTTIHIDGLLTCKDRIDTMERYAEIKKVIATDSRIVGEITITSLSLLHELPAPDLSPVIVEM